MRVKTTVKSGDGPGTAAGRKVKTGVKAGGIIHNHNETALQAAALKVKTGVKAGGIIIYGRDGVQSGLKIKTGVKAGGIIIVY
jgi:hypothetical protein